MLLGEGGRPVGLREHLSAIGAAFRLPGALLNLAQSIRGLWKTDLFLGSAELDRWVGASVDTGLSQLNAAKSPHIAIIPSIKGRSDVVRRGEQKNLVICPVPRDGSFVQIFHAGWRIVQALCAGDFKMPGAGDIPSPLHREVARIYAERREFPIVDVVEAIRKFAQPELLTTSTETVPNVPFATTAAAATSTIISPIPSTLNMPAEMCERPAPSAY